MSGHAARSPSKWDLYCACPGAWFAEQGFEDQESSAAKHGTVSHALLELCLLHGKWKTEKHRLGVFPLPGGGTDTKSELYDGCDLGEATEVLELDDDNVFVVNEALKYLKARVEELGERTSLRSEERVDCGPYLQRDDVRGTADAILISGDSKTLEIVDLKGGRMFVPATTRQMVSYSAGAMHPYEYEGSVPFNTVRRTIIQPRNPGPDDPIPGVRWVEGSVQDLRDELFLCGQKLAETDDPNAPRTPGDHCTAKFCKARDVCPARLGEFVGEMEPEWREVVVSPPEELPARVDALAVLDITALTGEQLGAFHRSYKLMEKVGKMIDAELFRRAEAGDTSTGFKVVEGRSNRQWARSEEEMFKALRNMGLKKEDYAEEKLRSPTQVEKHPLISGSPRKAANLAKLIEKPAGKPTLAPLDDSRPALRAPEIEPPPELGGPYFDVPGSPVTIPKIPNFTQELTSVPENDTLVELPDLEALLKQLTQ